MRAQQGVSMIEVLVALLVLSIGLIGVAALQTSGVQGNYLAYQYTQATTLAQNLAERMRANQTGVLDNSYLLAFGEVPPEPAVDCSDAPCSPAEQAAWDLAVWYAMLSNQTYPANVPPGMSSTLPSGTASVTCNDVLCIDNSTRLITVYWDAARSGASGAGCDPDVPGDLKCIRLVYVP